MTTAVHVFRVSSLPELKAQIAGTALVRAAFMRMFAQDVSGAERERYTTAADELEKFAAEIREALIMSPDYSPWLVLARDENGGIQYLVFDISDPWWTFDRRKATRFPTRETAETAAQAHPLRWKGEPLPNMVQQEPLT